MNHHSKNAKGCPKSSALNQSPGTGEPESVLAESDADMGCMQALSGIGTWRFEPGTQMFRWSFENFRIFGTSPSVMPVLTLDSYLTLIHQDDRARVEQAFSGDFKNLLKGMTFRILSRKNIRWIRQKSMLERDASGTIHTLFGITQDITRRKIMQNRLATREIAFRQLADANLFGVGFGDTQGNVTYVNDEMLRMMGVTRQDAASGKLNWVECLAPEYRGEHLRTWAESLHQTGQVRGYEREFVRPDGVRTPFIGATALVDPHLDFHVSIALDMTTIKAHERRLETANEELERRVKKRTAQLRALASRLIETEDAERQRLSEFLHDSLQQQLAVVKLRMNRIIPKEQRSKATEHRIADAMSLVDDAIAHTRQLSRELNPLNLRMHGLFKALQHLAGEMRDRYGLTVSLSLDDQAEPREETIASILLRASREMLYNVVKHAEVLTATLTIFRDGGKIVFQVEDQGQGIDRDALARKRESGQCLGLLSIEERIHDLGGEISLYSEPKKGCRITLTIPVGPKYSPDPGAIPSTDEPTLPSRLASRRGKTVSSEGRTRVVLADDHEIMRQSLAGVLMENQGFEIVGEAQNGEEAVRLTNELAPDVVIMDVEMPVMNGIQATAAITEKHPETIIIGLSMHDDDMISKQMKASGAREFLSKAASLDQLCDVIRHHLPAENITLQDR